LAASPESHSYSTNTVRLAPQRSRRIPQRWHGHIIAELTNIDNVVMIAAAPEILQSRGSGTWVNSACPAPTPRPTANTGFREWKILSGQSARADDLGSLAATLKVRGSDALTPVIAYACLQHRRLAKGSNSIVEPIRSTITSTRPEHAKMDRYRTAARMSLPKYC
jgi:hypothetical protein